MEALKNIENDLKGKTIELSEFEKDKTVLIVIDMVNGFVYSGPLSSPRVAGIVKNTTNKYNICRMLFHRIIPLKKFPREGR